MEADRRWFPVLAAPGVGEDDFSKSVVQAKGPQFAGLGREGAVGNQPLDSDGVEKTPGVGREVDGRLVKSIGLGQGVDGFGIVWDSQLPQRGVEDVAAPA